MTGNEIVTLAKKRIQDTSNSVDWNSLFAMTIDEIFTEKRWRFARQELNYIHPQSVGDYQFNTTPTELALNRILEMRVTTSYTIVMGVPIPVANTQTIIDYLPMPEFRELYLDNIVEGTPLHFTIVTDNDGTNGMHIVVGPAPNTDAAIWIDGDFIPSYSIDANPMPILPKQFHRMVVDGIVHLAAEERDLPKKSAVARRRFEVALAKLDLWDVRNSKHNPVLKPYSRTPRRGPFFPAEFGRPFSR